VPVLAIWAALSRRYPVQSSIALSTEEGVYDQHIVGESHYQPALRRCRVGDELRLVPEPDNPYDPNAIMVSRMDGKKIGYLPHGSGWSRHPADCVGFRVRLTRLGPAPGSGLLGAMIQIDTR